MFAGLPSKRPAAVTRTRESPAFLHHRLLRRHRTHRHPRRSQTSQDETGTALASALLTPEIDDEPELLKLLLDQLPELQPEW